MKHRFVVFKSGDSWYITIRSINGQPILTSEGYSRRDSALDSLRSLFETIVHIADNAFQTGNVEKLMESVTSEEE